MCQSTRARMCTHTHSQSLEMQKLIQWSQSSSNSNWKAVCSYTTGRHLDLPLILITEVPARAAALKESYQKLSIILSSFLFAFFGTFWSHSYYNNTKKCLKIMNHPHIFTIHGLTSCSHVLLAISVFPVISLNVSLQLVGSGICKLNVKWINLGSEQKWKTLLLIYLFKDSRQLPLLNKHFLNLKI